MSKIGQPELGYLPLNFFNFSNFQGVATITQTNIIQSVSNFGNRKDHMKYRSSSNISEIGQPEVGYLPLNFFNFSHFRGVATITSTNIIRSVSNFGNRKVPRKYRSSSNMSKIGQPKLGYLPLNFFNFPNFRGVATITWTNIIWSVSNFGNKKVPRKRRSSLNMSKIGEPELGYLPLNFFNFSNFRGVATITDLFQTLEIGRTIWNTGVFSNNIINIVWFDWYVVHRYI